MTDSMGKVEIPANALYQAQTQRALDNFRISSLRLPASMVRAIALLKQACAATNVELEKLDAARGE
ncbi:MAG: lyase family protein, partial [Gammaproteobacteria bacterium]|nr:lyase family protein [Gammaproteobacteria bacterium]